MLEFSNEPLIIIIIYKDLHICNLDLEKKLSSAAEKVKIKAEMMLRYNNFCYLFYDDFQHKFLT